MGGYAGGSTAPFDLTRTACQETEKEKFNEHDEGGGSNGINLFIEQIRKRIEDLCARKWPYIEKEDREQEAMVELVKALQNLRLDDGHFWQDYEFLLDQHMRQRKDDMISLFRYRCRSLDAPVRTKIPGKPCTLSLFLESNDY